MGKRGYSSSELIEYAECTPKAFRVYRERGLIPEEMRLGRRRYREPVLYRLKLIASLRKLGLGIDEIEDLLQMHADRLEDAGPIALDMAEKLGALVRETQEEIDRLRRIRNSLIRARETLAACAMCRSKVMDCSTCADDGRLDGVARTLLTDS